MAISIKQINEGIEIAAQEIVGSMIDSGFIDSEPEADCWQHEIVKTIREKVGL